MLSLIVPVGSSKEEICENDTINAILFTKKGERTDIVLVHIFVFFFIIITGSDYCHFLSVET